MPLRSEIVSFWFWGYSGDIYGSNFKLMWLLELRYQGNLYWASMGFATSFRLLNQIENYKGYLDYLPFINALMYSSFWFDRINFGVWRDHMLYFTNNTVFI